jgi:hypothetical protein
MKLTFKRLLEHFAVDDGSVWVVGHYEIKGGGRATRSVMKIKMKIYLAEE